MKVMLIVFRVVIAIALCYIAYELREMRAEEAQLSAALQSIEGRLAEVERMAGHVFDQVHDARLEISEVEARLPGEPEGLEALRDEMFLLRQELVRRGEKR